MKHILLFSFLTGGIAQSYDWDDEKKMRGRSSPEKMENMIVWRLTDELDLSTDQAEKFFPRFRQHRKSLEEIGKQEREMIANIDREEPNKKDVKKMIEEISKLRQNRIELEADFELITLGKTSQKANSTNSILGEENLFIGKVQF